MALFEFQHMIALVIAVSLILGSHGRSIPATLNIGFMSSKTSSGKFDLSGTQSLQAMIMAVREINNKSDGIEDRLLPDTHLQFVSRAPRRTFTLAAASATDMTTSFSNAGILACVGPASLSATSASALVFNEYGTLSISHGAYFSQLSYANTYNYLLRTIPSNSFQGRALADILYEYGWMRVAVFASSDVVSANAASEFYYQAAQLKINILSDQSFTEGTTDLSVQINRVKDTGARIFVLFMNYTDGANLLQQGADMKLFIEGTQILGIDSLATKSLWTSMSSTADKASILKGMITLNNVLNGNPSNKRSDFVYRWRNQSSTAGIRFPNGSTVCDQTLDDASYFSGATKYKLYEDYINSSASSKVCAGYDFPKYFKEDGSNILNTAYYAYDAVYALARGIHNLLYYTSLSLNAANIKAVMISNVSFVGVSGAISFSVATQGSIKYAEGDRQGGVKYQILNFQPDLYTSSSGAQGFAVVGEWITETGLNLCTSSSSSCSTIVYNTKDNSVSTDVPGPIYLTMQSDLRGFIYFLGALVLALSLCYLSALAIYYNTKIIKASQPGVMVFIIGGGIVGSIRVLAGALDISDSTCELRLWTGHLAFLFVFAALAVKLYRIHVIVNNNTLKRITITTTKAVTWLSIGLFLACIYLIAVTLRGNPHKAYVSSVEKLQVTYQSYCRDEEPAFAIAMYALEGVLMAIGAYLCYATKDAPDAINESSYIAASIASIILLIILAFPMVFLLDFSKVIDSTIEAVAFAFAGLLALNILFMPKIYHLYAKGDIKIGRKPLKGLKSAAGKIAPTAAPLKQAMYAPSVSALPSTAHTGSQASINNESKKKYFTPSVTSENASKTKCEVIENQILTCYEQIKVWKENLVYLEQMMEFTDSEAPASDFSNKSSATSQAANPRNLVGSLLLNQAATLKERADDVCSKKSGIAEEPI